MHHIREEVARKMGSFGTLLTPLVLKLRATSSVISPLCPEGVTAPSSLLLKSVSAPLVGYLVLLFLLLSDMPCLL